MSTPYSIFDDSILDITKGELVKSMDELLDSIAPEGKTKDNFTGGYIQQLKNSTRFTAFFGTKVGSTNKDTVQVNIEDNEMDLMYIMLKAKIHEMKNSKATAPKVSLANILAKHKDPLSELSPWAKP